MKRRLDVVTLAVLLLVGSVGCRMSTPPLGVPGTRRTAATRVRVRVVEDGRAALRHVTLEDYVRGSILAEFAPAGGDPAIIARMLEVQAVLSRTYALAHLGRHDRDGYDLCATTHCQLFDPGRLKTSRWARSAADATRQTAGTVLWFDRDPATALFHADCGGHTSTPVTIWGGGAPPYLRASADDGPASDAHAAWRYTATREAIRLALNADARTRIGARLDSITVLERDDAGRAVRIRLAGRTAREVRGEMLREALTRRLGARTIKSTLFVVRKAGASFVFEGRGFGHGVGLCQAGALARIAAGSSPTEVLSRYFPGTKIVELR